MFKNSPQIILEKLSYIQSQQYENKYIQGVTLRAH